MNWKFWKKENHNNHHRIPYSLWEDENWQKEKVLKDVENVLDTDPSFEGVIDLLCIVNFMDSVREKDMELMLSYKGYNHERFAKDFTFCQAFCLIIQLPDDTVRTTEWGKEMLVRIFKKNKGRRRRFV